MMFQKIVEEDHIKIDENIIKVVHPKAVLQKINPDIYTFCEDRFYLFFLRLLEKKAKQLGYRGRIVLTVEIYKKCNKLLLFKWLSILIQEVYQQLRLE